MAKTQGSFQKKMCTLHLRAICGVRLTPKGGQKTNSTTDYTSGQVRCALLNGLQLRGRGGSLSKAPCCLAVLVGTRPRNTACVAP